jgi:hypothetical protein
MRQTHWSVEFTFLRQIRDGQVFGGTRATTITYTQNVSNSQTSVSSTKAIGSIAQR